MDQWWLLGKDRTPIGPASTDLVRQGILAGRVPGDSLICEVGGPEWRSIRDISAFAKAFATLRIDGPTMVDPPELLSEPLEEKTATTLRRFEPQADHTVADARPLPSEPPGEGAEPIQLRPKLQRFDDGTELTVVDQPLESEPPI